MKKMDIPVPLPIVLDRVPQKGSRHRRYEPTLVGMFWGLKLQHTYLVNIWFTYREVLCGNWIAC